MGFHNTYTFPATRFKRCLEIGIVYRALAMLGVLLGMVAASLPARAADAPPPRTWAELTAERHRLGRQLKLLKAIGNTDEATAVSETLNELDRRLIESAATDAAQKRLQQACREELRDRLGWLAQQHCNRQEWSTAGRFQKEFADLCEAIYGKADFRSIDARNGHAYLARLSELKPDDLQQIVRANRVHSEIADLCRRRKFVEAIDLAKDVAQIRQRLLGDTSPRYATSLDAIAVLYSSLRDYAHAEPLYVKALAIRKEVLGENHPGYAQSLNNLAQLYAAQRDYARAEPLFRQTLEIRKRVLGEKHPYYAGTLGNLAEIYKAQGDYARAEPLARQAMEIGKIAFGENHPAYAQSLENLANLYYYQGDYARAESLVVKTIDIRRKTLGENHPAYAASLNDLAGLYQTRGDYARAEPLLRQASKVWKKALGENHPNYATSLNNLAGLYQAQGDYTRAESLFRQASELRKKALGENHPDYAQSLDNLADLYEKQGDYARAGPLIHRADEIRKKVLGENHPDYATSLNNLARLYRAQGDDARAEAIWIKAIEIKKKTLGEYHRSYANSLNSLAGLYEHHRDYVRAAPLYTKVIEICKKAMGENHPSYATSLYNLAGLYQAQGDYARAEPFSRQAVLIQRRQLEATAVVQSERQQLAMLQSVRLYLDGYLALTAGQDPFSVSAYQQILAWKGIVFRRERLARAGEQTPELLAIFRKLQQVAGQLAKQAWATPDPKQEVHWRENVERLSAEKERLEAELSDRSAAYRQAKKQVTLEELQQALPKEAVLVDILQYNHCTPPDKTAGTKTSWQQRLVAFVVRHDGPVARVNLGPMGPVSEAIDTWRTTFGMSPQGAAAGRWLRQKLWEPVEAQLGGAKIVLVSPDGALSRLPLGALPGKEPGKYLIEDYTLAIVPTAQVIPEIVQEQGRKELRKHLLLLGNIDYDAQPGKSAPAPTSPMQPTRALPRGFSHFDRLPGTADEVAAITRLYQSDFGRDGITTLAQREASKRSFLAEAGLHRYLHLATHGFFVEEKLPTPALLGQRGSERFGEMLHGPQTAEVHAGLLSGLALAGANRAGRAEARDVLAENDSDDGILTAEELGTQNLDGVQLVVLSACETGLGKAAAGEGLLGLQRAFQSAGARTVVASLWSVPDNETRMLMEAFYTNLWTRKQGALDSLRQAQLAMLHGGGKAGQLRGAERDIEDDHSGHARFSPRYWAAFVLSGDWR